MTARNIREIRTAQPSRDGDGVAIQRISGMGHAGMDPILMIDELRAEQREDLGGGFPPHPHRGMQTLTYMKHGGIIHEDSRGNRGEIRGGGAQWMSAGRGLIHSEMPTADTVGMHGFQLWVNLPAAIKMDEPRYRDVPADELARATADGFGATAVSGTWDISGSRVTGPLAALAEQASILDLQLAPGASVSLATGADDNALVYVYEGSLAQPEVQVVARQMAISNPGDTWQLTAGEDGAEVLVLRGAPIAEPVVHYGPFVMNTAEEIEQAIRDFRDGTLA
ncbi:MAG: pirin family protein [Pseudomonadota bacterium]